MKHEVEIGFSESVSLITICIITKMFYGYLPVGIAKYGPAAWYISIISAVVSFLIYYFILKRGGDIFITSVKGFGRFAGLLVLVYFIIYTSANIHEIVRIIQIYNFPSTPAFVFVAAFIVTALIINYNGLYSVGGLSVFYIKLIVLAFLAVFILGIGQYDFVRLAPIGGYGIKSIAKGSVTHLTLFSELFFILLLTGKTGGIKNARKIGVYSVLVSAVITALSFIAYTCVFDFTVASGKSSGLIEVVKNIYYGHLFQRMESLLFLVMVVSSAVAVCVWFFATVHLCSQVFGIRDKKEILLPLAVIILCISLSELNGLFNIVCRFGGLFLLIISLVTGLFRRKA